MLICSSVKTNCHLKQVLKIAKILVFPYQIQLTRLDLLTAKITREGVYSSRLEIAKVIFRSSF